MLSTPSLKRNDDPHDVLVVAPDVAFVVPSDDELSKLAHSLRHPSAPQISTGSEPPAGTTVPPVDATFRPAVGDVRIPRPRQGGRVFTTALLLAACAGAAAFAWQTYGDPAKRMIALETPQRILTSLLSLEKPAPSTRPTPPADKTVTANTASAQVAAPAQTVSQPPAAAQSAPQPAASAEAAPQAVAPSAAEPSVESEQSLRVMAHDLANAGQEIEQLKTSIEQLKGRIDQLTAGQQQMSRDIAKSSELNLRPKILPPPRRPAMARERRPPPVSRPQATLAPMSTQAAAPYVPRRPEPPPQDTGEPQADPELASVPRPPMPVR